jgi:hypothetical protein
MDASEKNINKKRIGFTVMQLLSPTTVQERPTGRAGLYVEKARRRSVRALARSIKAYVIMLGESRQSLVTASACPLAFTTRRDKAEGPIA